MIQIRSGVFETNSSSTHSICIQKKPVDADCKSITFLLGDYGWEVREVDFADYLYTAIMMDDRESVRKHNMAKLKRILDSHHIKYTFEEPKFDFFDGNTYLQNGDIDHYHALGSFVDTVLNNEDMLLRGLFGGYSAVYTGNDNTCDENSRCYSAIPTIYYDDDGNTIPNPNHDEDNFDYFYKGN